ncbi:hypothetical protein COO91_10658 (plasmid) [Nostoc flagelliforme CCNUN1]|uniref:Uncharacterized protein n=1 Tax=Nostoc flagelliforme CCNUN1 TaxID=2038116 RepID=A0A2K8TBH0_9NOSO|nr:hypothetical protein COO91_10658 [Nostoc flagelliforme CCNUN1]
MREKAQGSENTVEAQLRGKGGFLRLNTHLDYPQYSFLYQVLQM